MYLKLASILTHLNFFRIFGTTKASFINIFYYLLLRLHENNHRSLGM